MTPYVKYFRTYWKELKNSVLGYPVIINYFQTKYKKKALVIYITEPFTVKKNIHLYRQNYFHASAIVHALSNLKYNVDIVHYLDNRTKLTQTYDAVFTIEPVLKNESFLATLKKSKKRILFLTGAFPDYANAAEQERQAQILQKKKVKLKLRRQVPQYSPEKLAGFSSLILMGNQEFTLTTYPEKYQKDIELISNTAYPWLKPVSNNSKATVNFLYLAGFGQMHKGLDLLLEIFQQHTDWHLYICSPLEFEQDFASCYRSELSQKNIHVLGKVELDSPVLLKTAEKCSFFIHPSCSEGMTGSALLGMSLGLIPLLSKECGIDSSDCSIISRNVDEMNKELTKIVETTTKKDLIRLSQKYSNLATGKYDPSHFEENIQEILLKHLE